MNLDGKSVLVTGAAAGLGRAMALALLEAGAGVTLTDVSEAALSSVSKEIERFGARAAIVPADLTRPVEIDRLLRTAIERLGPVNVLINNAGIGAGIIRRDHVTNLVRFWEHSEEHTRRFFEVNSIAPYLLAVRVVKGMMERKWGRIINVTTSLDTMLRPGFAGYGGSKAGLEAHTAIMAGDLLGTGVTANVLVPGGPANTALVPLEAGFDRSKLIQPEAMAAPVVWLASDESKEVTGRRFLAVKWDPSLPNEVASEKAIAPIAWSGLGSQTVYPQGHV